MERKIKRLMATVFRIDESAINDVTSPDTVETWDSLAHMNMIAAIEEEFDVRCTEEDIIEMISYELICTILKQKLA